MTTDVSKDAARGSAPTLSAGQAVKAGVIAGLAGGVGFGILMQTEGMLPLVASLVGGSASSLGWTVHLVISLLIGGAFAVLGVTFAIVFAQAATGIIAWAVRGLLYGAFWWVLGGLFLMPVWLGMDAFTINDMAWTSLTGHLIYGLVLGVVYGLATRLMSRRRSS